MTELKNATLVEWPTKLDVKGIADKFGSPSWILCETQLKINVNLFTGFTGDPSRIFYPVKTNPSLSVLQVLAKLGVGADCASRLEVHLALLAGITFDRISYNSPAQDIILCKWLLEQGSRVVMDDLETILELQESISSAKINGKLFLRLNLEDSIGYSEQHVNQELMAHGSKSSKFGIPVEDLNNVIQLIKIPISGLHVHVGTQMDNLKSFEYALISLNNLAENLESQGQTIEEINIGGGLGIPFSAKDSFPSLDFWVNSLIMLKSKRYSYCVEPGHALVGNVVALITNVLTIKKSRGKNWAIIDVGTDQLAKITLLKWPHRILNESGGEFHEGIDAIAGPLCFAGDTLLDNVSLEKIKKGSYLIITEVGAYTFSLANKFNGRLAPKWLIQSADGSIKQIMEKESVYDEYQYTKHEWFVSQDSQIKPLELDLKQVRNLSSAYLKETSSLDHFEYLEVKKISSNFYEFNVSTSSKVDFLSMPFAIRIIGDATIISVLEKNQFREKEIPVWGRKLTMDCFDQVESNTSFKFTIALSEQITVNSKKTLIARFKSSCGKLAGNIVVSF